MEEEGEEEDDEGEKEKEEGNPKKEWENVGIEREVGGGRKIMNRPGRLSLPLRVGLWSLQCGLG